MLTLIVRQSLKNGTAKTWKLKPNKTIHTFGSSRLADVISIAPESKGIQGLFEYRDGCWWYVDLNMATSTSRDSEPALRLDKETSLTLEDATLSFTPLTRDADLFMRLEKGHNEERPAGKKFQLYLVKQNDQILETRILPLNKKFKPNSVQPPTVISSVPGVEWHSQTIGNTVVKQRTVSLEDAAKMARISADQIIDEDSKKGVFALLGVALLLVTVSLFGPKSETIEVMAVPPKSAQKIIVKTELKPQKKRVQKAPAPQQVAAKQAPAPSGGGKVAKMMKSLAGGRISQLLGKVSAQAAKSGNVVIANGQKAGAGPSGRALASVGKIERSGRDWGKDGNGAGVVISTAGRGGGGSASNMGGLAAGATGSGGVGLIEEESEITGGLDREIIAQYIKSKLGQILYCYERQLSAKPDLFGKVAVKFTIGPSGQVEQQLIGDTTLKNATVEGCILNRVAAWKFPAPQGGTRVLVTYPFLFKSTN